MSRMSYPFLVLAVACCFLFGMCFGGGVNSMAFMLPDNPEPEKIRPADAHLTGLEAFEGEDEIEAEVKRSRGHWVEPEWSKEPIEMWRAWNLTLNEHGLPRLGSITYSGYTWPPRQPLRAECATPDDHGGHCFPPERRRERGCGIYGKKRLNNFKRASDGEVVGGALHWGEWRAKRGPEDEGITRVVGEAFYWGRCLRFTDGVRAEWCYPKHLYLHPDTDIDYLVSLGCTSVQQLAQQLRLIYGVPVTVSDLREQQTYEKMVELRDHFGNKHGD